MKRAFTLIELLVVIAIIVISVVISLQYRIEYRRIGNEVICQHIIVFRYIIKTITSRDRITTKPARRYPRSESCAYK